MVIIFLNYAVLKEQTNNKAVSAPANEMALGIINILEKEWRENFHSIRVMPIQIFPTSKKFLFKKNNYQSILKKNEHPISFINFPIIKQIIIMLKVSLIIFFLLFKNRNQKNIVITVNSNAIFSLPLFLTFLFKKTERVCYLSDMPFEARKRKNILKEASRLFDNQIRISSLKIYEHVICFVKATTDKFAKGKRILIIDHIFDEKSYLETKNRLQVINNNDFNIVYTGSLNNYYRIKELISSLKYLPDNYKLYLYGKGEYEEYVKEQAIKDPRIIYGGFQSTKDIPEIQKSASLLIVLLRTDMDISKYAIPSKIVGYLASGTPILTSKANSIPEKYIPYLNFTDDSNPESIAKKILFLSKEGREKSLIKSKQANDFIFNVCNWRLQEKQIVSFIKNIF